MKLAKKWQWALIITTCLILMAATIPAAIWVTNTQSAKLGNAQARCANKPGASHQVIIQNGRVMPSRTLARKCDNLTITNRDNQARLLAFGSHDNHISYDGVSERILSKDQSLSVTLITPGSFIFHDHQDPAVRGSFTVAAD